MEGGRHSKQPQLLGPREPEAMVGTFKDEAGTGVEGRALGLEREVYNRDPSKELGLFLGVTGSHGEHLSERGFVSF